MNIQGFQRIAIVGNNGSGKSYLARGLSEIMGLPLIHLDKEYWRPGWAAPTENEWICRQQELVSSEKWIIDGTHSGTMELRFSQADLVIFLDRNRLACLAGVVKRYGKQRPDMPNYLVDKVDRRFFSLTKGALDLL